MPSKLDNLEFDIISLLQRQEPKMLRWSEIVKSLWNTNKFKYKDEKGFGVAVTSKLNLLVAGNKIKKEEIYYGSISSVLEKRSSNTKGSWNPEPKADFLVTQKRIDETEYPSTLENWDSLLSNFSKAGANLIEVKVEKQQLGTKSVIQGVIVLRGAKKLQEAIKMYVPDQYDAFLFTEASLDKNDKLTWQGINFRVKETEDIYDVYSLSYRIAKLVSFFGRESVPLNAFRFGKGATRLSEIGRY
jgi:hypothetical protein